MDELDGQRTRQLSIVAEIQLPETDHPTQPGWDRAAKQVGGEECPFKRAQRTQLRRDVSMQSVIAEIQEGKIR